MEPQLFAYDPAPIIPHGTTVYAPAGIGKGFIGPTVHRCQGDGCPFLSYDVILNNGTLTRVCASVLVERLDGAYQWVSSAELFAFQSKMEHVEHGLN